jgi:hypothetical protein
MTWMNASLRAFVIFGYFVVATVWLPNLIVRLGPVASAPSFVSDSVVLAVWGTGLVVGLWLLRFSQRRGLI